MGTRRVTCPKCSAALTVPAELGNMSARCGRCQGVFRLPPPAKRLDEAVADWLNEPGEEEDLKAGPRELSISGKKPAAPAVATGTLAAPKPAPAPAQGLSPYRCPRLVSLERRGVLFEFAADCLLQTQFRAAIPRLCVHCMARSHLSAHLIIYTSQLQDSISLEAEHKAGQLVIPQDQLRDLHGQDLLTRLPKVPNVPHPGDLPMPYWVCDMCNGAGEISGQIHVNTDTGQGICRLFVRNVLVAAAFFANAGGESNPDYARLREHIEHLEEDRWDALPSVVRHRMEQWFRLAGGEKFLAYVPDRDRVRTEDGMGGLVISTTRLIYHRPPLHQETLSTRDLMLKAHVAGGKEVVAIEAPEFKRRSIVLDRSGLMLLRRALSEGKFPTSWV